MDPLSSGRSGDPQPGADRRVVEVLDVAELDQCSIRRGQRLHGGTQRRRVDHRDRGIVVRSGGREAVEDLLIPGRLDPATRAQLVLPEVAHGGHEVRLHELAVGDRVRSGQHLHHRGLRQVLGLHLGPHQSARDPDGVRLEAGDQRLDVVVGRLRARAVNR